MDSSRVLDCKRALERSICKTPKQLEHEAAWCSTFSCLKTSQTGDSAWFQNIRLTETRGLRLPDEPQEGRNQSWALEEFSATL
ncbi:hypothetical protein CSKR_110125 [Clonorchis sinensis]|uniref:Uncharacterized protein n=1 Tax=Clonorchis sinensis TaxID=79923 RepID=A0A419PNU8_CLOSI|nr:hypothetical protein CSKR_110125 [Clonorchis sinensis]